MTYDCFFKQIHHSGKRSNVLVNDVVNRLLVNYKIKRDQVLNNHESIKCTKSKEKHILIIYLKHN